MFGDISYTHVSAFLALGLTLLFTKRTKQSERRANEPPLSPGLPYIGHGIQFINNFSDLMDNLRTKFGPIYTIITFGQRMHFITDYKSIRKIWTQPAFDFREFAFKAEASLSGIEAPDELKASGVGSATLAKYAHTMRGDAPLESLATRFRSALRDTVERVPILHDEAWNEVDLRKFSGMIIFHAAGRSLFGLHWLEGVDIEVAARQYSIFEIDAPAIAGGLPRFLTQKGCHARDYLVKEVLLPVVKKGCDGGHSYIVDYLSELKEAYRDDENGDLKIAARLTGLLFAINTNTMNMLFWVIARTLLADKSLSVDLVDECKKAAISNPSSYLEQKRQMPLLNSVIIETFRLHGDPNSFRVVEKDCVVSGLAGGKDVAFRKGDSVFLLSTYDQLQDIAGDKDAFDGRRWIQHTSNKEINKGLLSIPSNQVLAPFGGGKHLCPGRFFALLEMHVVVAFCIQHYEFKILKLESLPPKRVELAAPINQPNRPMKISIRYKV